jgi:chorismate synthase
MKIERDTAHVLSGVRHGLTIGSPISTGKTGRNLSPSAREIPPSTSASPRHAPATPISPEL